jgi:hypothetical protein
VRSARLCEGVCAWMGTCGYSDRSMALQPGVCFLLPSNGGAPGVGWVVLSSRRRLPLPDGKDRRLGARHTISFFLATHRCCVYAGAFD